MTAKKLREKFIGFFLEKGHKLVPSASLIPENDPTALFISAGMHPLVPYLLGEPHPLGKRLCSVQKCLRTDDIDEVGDETHHTFFEMMGNWSLGDYWKEEAISWSYEFLTKYLNIDPKLLFITCFAGDQDAPKDTESAEIWKKLGIPNQRIFFLPKKDNWWGPAGKTGPCGPDSEMFFDTGKQKCGPDCRPGCHCGKFIEIWNDVFMQYNKKLKVTSRRDSLKGVSEKSKVGEEEYEFVPLEQKNVDTGMGVERVGIFNGIYDNYQTDLFAPIIAKIEEISKKKYINEDKKPMRVIADHLRAATFIINDSVVPGNVEQGYVLRRLIRRAIRFGRELQLNEPFTGKVAESVIQVMSDVYPELLSKKAIIFEELSREEERFSQTLERGIEEFERLISKNQKISGKDAFFLYETYGFPVEVTSEMAKEKGLSVNEEEFKKAAEEHQKKSRIGAEKKFSGGLADHSEQVVKYHTATHLLHAALRKVLGENVCQVGSNLTSERLRFDFTHPEKLTDEQLKQVQDLVNQQIEADSPVTMEIMNLDEAKKAGALAFFDQKYGEKVKVYTIGPSTGSGLPSSKEVCGGPHVKRTGEIGKIEVFKEEAVGTGKRRIYARALK